MRLCARRVSGAAHREQRCGFVVMDGWRPAAFRILAQEADDRPKSLAPLAAGEFAAKGRTSFAEGRLPQRHATGASLTFSWERSFEPPAQLMLAQPERGGR